MELMQNLCRRYRAAATCHTSVNGMFNESNVRGWIDKLRVGSVVTSIEPAESAHIDVVGADGLVARVVPFAADYQAADAWVVVRQTVLATGRLPGVELHESGSKYLSKNARELAERVSREIDGGNDALAKYLGQPFFVAEPWTSTPGVTTDRQEMLIEIRGLLGIDPVKPVA
jgi:hypothetical protein